MSKTQKRQTFMIVREEFDGPDVPIEDRLSLVQTLDTQEAAEREVERLTCSDVGKPWRYYWQEWTVETSTE